FLLRLSQRQPEPKYCACVRHEAPVPRRSRVGAAPETALAQAPNTEAANTSEKESARPWARRRLTTGSGPTRSNRAEPGAVKSSVGGGGARPAQAAKGNAAAQAQRNQQTIVAVVLRI